MPANTSLAEDQATVLKLWAAMGGDEETLTNGSDDVNDWKGIRVNNGRVTKIGEREDVSGRWERGVCGRAI